MKMIPAQLLNLSIATNQINGSNNKEMKHILMLHIMIMTFAHMNKKCCNDNFSSGHK